MIEIFASSGYYIFIERKFFHSGRSCICTNLASKITDAILEPWEIELLFMSLHYPFTILTFGTFLKGVIYVFYYLFPFWKKFKVIFYGWGIQIPFSQLECLLNFNLWWRIGDREPNVVNQVLLRKWLWCFGMEENVLRRVLDLKYGTCWESWCSNEVRGHMVCGLVEEY